MKTCNQDSLHSIDLWGSVKEKNYRVYVQDNWGSVFQTGHKPFWGVNMNNPTVSLYPLGR
jgi:hypothetical protein